MTPTKKEMTRPEVYDWLCANPPERWVIMYDLLKNEELTLWEVVEMQERALRDAIRENREQACEGATIACLYRDEMYGKGQNYTSKQEVDDRAKDFINKVGCFPKIEK
mgnify:CR=1 FL=1